MPGGYFAENIGQELNRSDWFVVVFSPEVLASTLVKHETEQPMAEARYYGKVIPILAEPCAWKTLGMTASRST